MQRSGSREGTPALADGIRAAQTDDLRRQGAFAGNHREERSPASDSGNTSQRVVRSKTAVTGKIRFDVRTLSNGSLPDNGNIVGTGRHRTMLVDPLYGVSETQILIRG